MANGMARTKGAQGREDCAAQQRKEKAQATQVRRSVRRGRATRREQKPRKLWPVGGRMGRGSTSAVLADARLCSLTLCSSGARRGTAGRFRGDRRREKGGPVLRAVEYCALFARARRKYFGVGIVDGWQSGFRWEIGDAARSVARYRRSSGRILVGRGCQTRIPVLRMGNSQFPSCLPTRSPPPLSTVRCLSETLRRSQTRNRHPLSSFQPSHLAVQATQPRSYPSGRASTKPLSRQLGRVPARPRHNRPSLRPPSPRHLLLAFLQPRANPAYRHRTLTCRPTSTIWGTSKSRAALHNSRITIVRTPANSCTTPGAVTLTAPSRQILP